jgi:hypothetical protein
LVERFELPTAFYSTIAIIIVVSHFIWQKSHSKDNKSATTTFLCYFSKDIVCDLAVYGFWSDKDGYYFMEVRVQLQLHFFML